MVRFRRFGFGAVVLITHALIGCSGGDDDDDDEPRKPDTGYGAAQVVPDTINCVDYCARTGDCVETLCNENTHSTNYDGFGEAYAGLCESQCTDSLLQSQATAAEWQCLFKSSCRQAFDYDSCHVQASYSVCN